MHFKGNKGDTLKIFHAEALDHDGNFYTKNLRGAKQRNFYISNGKERWFQPHFTFQGFRYIKIEGVKERIKALDFYAIALYSDTELMGTFSSSDSLINRLQKNIEWGQKGNFLDIPMDCPQRDERLGWTGEGLQ